MKTRLPEPPIDFNDDHTEFFLELTRTLEQAIDSVTSSFSSAINVQSMSAETVDISGDYGRNSVIFVDTSGGDVDITLPPPSSNYRSVYVIKKITSDANNVTVAARVSGDVEGVSLYTLTGGTYPYVQLISDGYNYWVI